MRKHTPLSMAYCFGVLELLRGSAAPMTAKEIAEKFSALSQPQTNCRLQALKQRGAVACRMDYNDRGHRANFWWATPQD